jgi:Bacterial alpha-L-rhamnosidase C-terminal domain
VSQFTAAEIVTHMPRRPAAVAKYVLVLPIVLPPLGPDRGLGLPAAARLRAGRPDPLLRPYPGGSLSWARGPYRSVRGRISTGWKRVGDRFTFWAELPPNVSASVHIPSGRAAEVRDAAGNRPAALASFPKAREAREAVFHVGSGAHEFSGPAMTGG